MGTHTLFWPPWTSAHTYIIIDINKNTINLNKGENYRNEWAMVGERIRAHAVCLLVDTVREGCSAWVSVVGEKKEGRTIWCPIREGFFQRRHESGDSVLWGDSSGQGLVELSDPELKAMADSPHELCQKTPPSVKGHCWLMTTITQWWPEAILKPLASITPLCKTEKRSILDGTRSETTKKVKVHKIFTHHCIGKIGNDMDITKGNAKAY